MIRQPIVTVAGHVDHGKTTILDKFRGSCVAKGEAGGITQKISFTLFPAENIKKGCYLIDKHGFALEIPGFLFIDTPGHAAFTNLRKRGGNLADLSILVVDIKEGIKPQTAEVLQILKKNHVPFLIALNKIDNISGWKQGDDLKTSIQSQTQRVKQDFDEKLYTFMAALSAYKFESDLYYNITDFTKKIALVPCSGKTGEGIPELLMMLCGLSQRFLKKELSLGEKAKGVILEIKKEQSQRYAEAILYDGTLKVGDEIAIASFSDTVIAKIRVLEEIKPLCDKFQNKKEATASTGLRLQLITKEDILPGMPFVLYEGDLGEIEKEFKKEIGEVVKIDKEGIIAKADSLGSLEALLTLLKEAKISVGKMGIGNVNKGDIAAGKANLEINRENAVIAAFNIGLDEEIAKDGKVAVISEEIIYKLIENVQKWQEEKRKEIEREKLAELANIFKLEILPEYVFRNSKPAIFGVRVLGGKVKSGIKIIDDRGEEVGRVKNIQSESKSVDEAGQGQEVAISIPGVTFDRRLKEIKNLFSELSEKQFKVFKKHKELLKDDEKKALMEIADIKRKKIISWGM